MSRFILLLVCLSVSIHSYASENIFYALRFKSHDRMSSAATTLSSLEKNHKKINIFIPQAYSIHESGDVTGDVEPVMLNLAQKHSLKIMPLVTNIQFNKEKAHQFLFDINAQSKAMHFLVERCQENNFYGIQLDFEMIKIEDRDALTRFYKYAANEMHKHGFKISFAIAPVVTDKPESIFLDKIYTNWEGAYDLKQLGTIADFVSIMAYNQHGGVTTPGPTSSYAWVNQVVKYALQYIQPDKISLGLPDFSTHWYTGTDGSTSSPKVKVKAGAISYQSAKNLGKRHAATFVWDKNDKAYYCVFSRHWLSEYVFLEDVKSFKFKYDLIKKYKLRGISVFDLGTEDSRIWGVL